jgi:phosphohistidine swiveling domain-containing protein
MLDEIYESLLSEPEKGVQVRLGDEISKMHMKRRKEILKIIRPSKKIKILIETLSQTAFIRTEDNMLTGLSTYHIIPLQNEICNRIAVDYKGLKQLTPEEIVFYLRHHRKVPPPIIRKRLDICAYYFEGSDGYLILDEAKDIFKKIIGSRDSEKDENVLSGQVASKGEVNGRAFVVESSLSDMSDFKKGDILVAPATSADFVPYMRKASAIITEMGGLTSHAAIVSRELGIPCIVGVKGVTSSINTGDNLIINELGRILRLI